MSLHKNLLNGGFALPQCEKHFHDDDETWLILAGKGTSYWITHGGEREDFMLEAGDVWLVPAGYEHGSNGPNSPNFLIATFHGTRAPGAHEPAHLYVEEKGYIPSLQLVKTVTTRYRGYPTEIPSFVFPEQGRMKLDIEPFPALGPNQVLCRSLFSGLTNGTERNVLMGGNYGGKWPARFGYQNVGEVVLAGADVKSLAPGDVVFSADFARHRAWFSVPADHDLTIKLPSTIEPSHAALLGMASVAFNNVRAADIRLSERVLVVGAGAVGLFTAQAARAAGADVTIVDLDDKRLQIARALGISKTLQTDTDEAWDALRASGPFDVVMEDSGGPVLDKIIGTTWGQALIRVSGRIALVAGRHEVNYIFNAAQGCKLRIVHVGHFERVDLQSVVGQVARGAIEVAPIIQQVVPYTEAAVIYDSLRDASNSVGGIVFDWRPAHHHAPAILDN